MSPRWGKLVHEGAELGDDGSIFWIVANSFGVRANLLRARGTRRTEQRLSNCVRLRGTIPHQKRESAARFLIEPD